MSDIYKKHILVISQYFYPEKFRINDICEEWVKRGYKVTVITGIPNYPQGEFYEGYGFHKKRTETWNGIDIIRIPLFPRGKSKSGLVLNYISFALFGKAWARHTKLKADRVFMFEVSPMTQCLIGVTYKKKYGVPITAYIQDLWPENIEVITGIHYRLVINAISRMADKIYKACDNILVTSPSFKTRLDERKSTLTDTGESKVYYWPQYAEEFYRPIEPSTDKMSEDLKEALHGKEGFKLAFTGNIGYAQGLDILPKVAALLKSKGIHCYFIIIGDGRYAETFCTEIKKNDVEEYFYLLGRKAPEDIPNYLAYCDAGYISFMDNELWSMTIPAKLQSYMACGKMIIASASGETRRIIGEAECGYCADTGDVVGTAEIIISAIEAQERIREFGHNARKYFDDHFDKNKLMDEAERYL